MAFGDENSYPGGGMFGAYLRAHQLFNLIQNTRNAGEDRKLTLEDRKRQQQLQDANLQIKLNDLGATATNPNISRVEAGLTDAIGAPADPRMKIDSPVGSYYLPTATEQTAKEQAAATAQLLAKAQAQTKQKVDEQAALAPGQVDLESKKATARESAKQTARPKFKLLPDVAQALGKNEATQEEIDSFVKQHNTTNPNLHLVTNTDDAGNVSVTAIDPKTFQRVGTLPLGQIGKSKTEAKPKPAQVFGEINKFEGEKKKIGTAYNKAELFEKRAAASKDPGDADKAAAARKEADAQLAYVTQMGKTMAESYPDQIESGMGDQGWPYVKMKQGGAATKQAKAMPPAAAAQVFPASKLAALAKRRKKDPNAVRKELTAAGYQIDERN
jgi:hypothetical protein